MVRGVHRAQEIPAFPVFLLRQFSIGAFPILRYPGENRISMFPNKLLGPAVSFVFISLLIKALDGGAYVQVVAFGAASVRLGYTAYFDLTSCFAQVPGPV